VPDLEALTQLAKVEAGRDNLLAVSVQDKFYYVTNFTAYSRNSLVYLPWGIPFIMNTSVSILFSLDFGVQ
jgi:hypothetical protein